MTNWHRTQSSETIWNNDSVPLKQCEIMTLSHLYVSFHICLSAHVWVVSLWRNDVQYSILCNLDISTCWKPVDFQVFPTKTQNDRASQNSRFGNHLFEPLLLNKRRAKEVFFTIMFQFESNPNILWLYDLWSTKNWYHILSNNKVINNPNFMIYDQPGIPYFGSMINKNYFSNLDFRNQDSINYYLVGGWTNPFEKYAPQNGNLPQIGMKINNI